MRSRAFRPMAAILSILLWAGTPVHADPVVVSEVVQVIGSYQHSYSLRLRKFYDGSNAVASIGGSGFRQQRIDGSLNTADSANSNLTTIDSVFSGVAFNSNEQGIGVDIVDQGDLEGTICDCGEIAVAGGGFPKWPLLFLAAIPFFFIHDCDNCNDDIPLPTPTPIPTPPPSQTPEPATLLLFGTGLLAIGGSLRRRHAKAQLKMQAAATEEG
jgi:PEP-CTERM motif